MLRHDGEKSEAVKHYLSTASKTPATFKGDAILRNLSVRNDDGVASLSFVPGQSITILARLCPPRPLAQASFGYGILNVYGDRVTTLHTCYQRTGTTGAWIGQHSFSAMEQLQTLSWQLQGNGSAL